MATSDMELCDDDQSWSWFLLPLHKVGDERPLTHIALPLSTVQRMESNVWTSMLDDAEELEEAARRLFAELAQARRRLLGAAERRQVEEVGKRHVRAHLQRGERAG